MKKKILALALAMFVSTMNIGTVFAIHDTRSVAKLQAAPNARTIDLALVFDGPSEKNAALLKTIQTTITRSL